jgi:large subunit ribosomal protein L19
MDLVETVINENLKKSVPEIRPGDRVRVHVRIVEGERERIQVFQGVVMRKRGGGIKQNFTVRRIGAHGVGVERTFFLHSPRLEKVEVVAHAHVRRAQLYYLRDRVGKAARLREKRMDGKKGAEVQPEPEPETSEES